MYVVFINKKNITLNFFLCVLGIARGIREGSCADGQGETSYLDGGARQPRVRRTRVSDKMINSDGGYKGCSLFNIPGDPVRQEVSRDPF